MEKEKLSVDGQNLESAATLRIMVYGVAGVGKSTLALSGEGKSFVIDFDNGMKRVDIMHRFGHKVWQPKKENGKVWEQIIKLFETEDWSQYNNVVVDTIGKMLDYIIEYKCGMAQPSLKQWGEINGIFVWFLNRLDELQKNVIFVAHDATTGADADYHKPAVREKNFTTIVTSLDLLGFVQAENINGVNCRTITFDATSTSLGKNSAQLPYKMVIPTIISNGEYTGNNTFLGRSVVGEYRRNQARQLKVVQQFQAVCEKIADDVILITDGASAKAFADNIDSYEHIGTSKEVAREMFKMQLAALGLKYNKETGEYEAEV